MLLVAGMEALLRSKGGAAVLALPEEELHGVLNNDAYKVPPSALCPASGILPAASLRLPGASQLLSGGFVTTGEDAQDVRQVLPRGVRGLRAQRAQDPGAAP